MLIKYLPAEFEKKWAGTWDREKTYSTNNQSPITNNQKMYVLAMFPYPSGTGLHVGHVRVYTGTDVVARYFRMNGYNVLHPMGWDAFGLPAENAAVKAKKNPMDMVPKNIATFKRQMKSLGFSYDWDHEFATTDPSYYKWTQWLFIQFYKMGLLYKKNTPINFCPVCKTGLAEEEVLANGTHERCGSKIEKKGLPQWIFKITKYADRLLSDLEGLDWPKGILEMQRNWIGKKEGINIKYQISNIKYQIECFTTRPDTNFGATFVVLAPEHEFVKKIIKGELKNQETNIEKIKKYVDKSKTKSEIERLSEGKEKTGIFTGFYTKNNLNGRKMPIYISDFVLSRFGTGAVVGVPGHDIRDFEFAKEFNLDVIRVVVGKNGDKSEITKKEQVQEEEGIMINSEFLDGLDIHVATKKIMDYFEKKGWGKRVTTYHLRDWIFSRQRYWGEPIPMVNCEKCGWQPIPESELPLKLPYIKSYEPMETGESPLSEIKDWVKTKCPKCGGPAKRETDTMPNWAGSCWYFLRFADTNNDKQPWSNETMKQFLPVDWYLGGAEHAVLHLLYSRFWVKALYDLKLLNFKEPFLRLRNLGMVLAEDHRKMSKSFGNIINPDDVVKEYGADALRIYEMFMAPFDAEISWSTKALQGSYRFVKRIWNLYQNYVGNKNFCSVQNESKQLIVKLQKIINKVTFDIPEIKFNTSIAAMMEFLNDFERNPQGLSKENVKKFLQILSPFAPFITEEIWRNVFGEKQSIHLSSWPTVSGEIVEEELIIPIQVNGKLRSTLRVSRHEISKNIVIKKALENEKVKKYLTDKPKKIIYVHGKIINLII
jgi:leucyl-tRNA synthetase